MKIVQVIFTLGVMVFYIGCNDGNINNPNSSDKNSSILNRSGANVAYDDLSPNYIDIYEVNKIIYTKGTKTYEDAEDGEILGWYIYDSSCAKVLNIDNDNSRIIQLKGSGLSSGFVLRDMNGEFLNNLDARVVQWSGKFSGDFIIFVSLLLDDDSIKYLSYAPKHYKNMNELFVKLSQWSSDGKWHTYKRDLRLDLQRYFPDRKIEAVLDFQVRGEGCLDDIKLLKIDLLEKKSLDVEISELKKKIDNMSNKTNITINNSNTNNNSDTNTNNLSNINNNDFNNTNTQEINSSKNLNLSMSSNTPDLMSGFATLMTQFASMMAPMVSTFMDMMEEMMNTILTRTNRVFIMSNTTENDSKMELLNKKLLDISEDVMADVIKMQEFGLDLNKIDTRALIKALADLQNNQMDTDTISNAMNAYTDLLSDIADLVFIPDSKANFKELNPQIINTSNSLLLFSTKLLKESMRTSKKLENLELFANFIKNLKNIIFASVIEMINNSQISISDSKYLLSTLSLIDKNMDEFSNS